MTTPEKPAFTPEQIYTTYLDGLKDYRGRAKDFHFILALKNDTTFGGLLENLTCAATDMDSVLRAFDPAWYMDGNYKTGILHPKLYEDMENYFREQKILEDDQVLTPICHYSNEPGNSEGYSNPERANLVIGVSGGKRHDWGQFILCWFEEDFSEFDFQENPQRINEMKKLARETGRQEISYEEAKAQYLERERMRDEL